MTPRSDLTTFCELLGDLEGRTGGRRRLRDCNGRMSWPERGVYFFFEPGEVRTSQPTIDRVVRVGTHALKENSRTTLWKLLSQHRGTTRSGGGNHRGSIFRLLVGEALMRRDQSLHIRSWGSGSTASRETRYGEREHEARVSDYLGNFTLLCHAPLTRNPSSRIKTRSTDRAVMGCRL